MHNGETVEISSFKKLHFLLYQNTSLKIFQ